MLSVLSKIYLPPSVFEYCIHETISMKDCPGIKNGDYWWCFYQTYLVPLYMSWHIQPHPSPKTKTDGVNGNSNKKLVITISGVAYHHCNRAGNLWSEKYDWHFLSQWTRTLDLFFYLNIFIVTQHTFSILVNKWQKGKGKGARPVTRSFGSLEIVCENVWLDFFFISTKAVMDRSRHACFLPNSTQNIFTCIVFIKSKMVKICLKRKQFGWMSSVLT